MSGQPKPRSRSRWQAVSVALLACWMPMTGYAVVAIYDPGTLSFSTSGRSMWGPSAAFILDKEIFLGTTWDTDKTNLGIGIAGSKNAIIFCIPNPITGACIPDTIIRGDTRTGYDASVKTSGKAGFGLGAKIDSGSVGAVLTYGASAELPDPRTLGTGDFFNLNPDSVLAGGELSTNLAEASGRVDAVLGAKGDFTGKVCFIGFGCSPDGDPASTSVGFDPKSLELLSFNDEDSPGEIKILGVADPALFNFGSPITVPNPANPLGEVGNVTIHIPDIDTLGGVSGDKLTSSGMDDFLDLRVDIDGLILGAFGLPGLGISVDAGIFSISGDLLDVELGPTIKLIQDFELTPTLMVDLEFDLPVLVAGETDPVTSLTAAWDALPDIALLTAETLVTPTFWIDALFNNMTSLGVDGVFTLDVLKASLGLGFAGLSVDVADFGPLFRLEERGSLFSSPALFDSTYALGGFDRILGEPFLLRVPEPATSALLGIGLLALAGAARRRRRCPV